ncbi:MAG: hypothetical protein K6G07_00585 [Lachnospiraceae bacterium]|nr:hypothetical protein [Lachnospiraceae bacterium]
MFFKCKNCGANTVWNPEKRRMCCPHCESIDSEDMVTSTEDMVSCPACGAPIQPKQYESATKCEHCGSYIIFEERINGELLPHLILPFLISKEKAKEEIKKQFGKMLFVPFGFLREASLDKMEGDYVPFFLFDMHGHYQYSGKGRKVRTWISGNTEFTETSIYQITRDMTVDYSRVPADASLAMPDGQMDLLEPYDYQGMTQFHPRFMSGFFGEYYSVGAEAVLPRALAKTKESARHLLQGSIGGYSSVSPEVDNYQAQVMEQNYALLPVWRYVYSYRGKNYNFYLNGQTGKLVGDPPIAKGKLVAYGLTVFAGVAAMVFSILSVAGVL